MWAFTWPFRIAAIAVSIVGTGAALFALGAIVWRAVGRGRPIDLAEEAKKFWGDVDEAAAFIRSVLYIGLGALNLALMALLVGIFGRMVMSEAEWFFGYFLFSSLILAVFWWLEREFAWPGLLVIPEVRGTRGLFFARRDRRRRAKEERGSDHQRHGG